MKDTQQDIEDEAERMGRGLEELDEHAEAAEKKAEVTREQTGPEAKAAREQADREADEPPGEGEESGG